MKKFKKFMAVFLSAATIFTLTACGDGKSTSESSSKSESSSQQSSTSTSQETGTTIKDREGNDMKVPENVDSIISMAPSVTQTLISLGLGNKLVAVDKYSLAIEGVNQDLPSFDIMAPDVESISALNPDIIFATGMSKSGGDDPFKAVTDLGVLMTYIPSATKLSDIKEDILFLGQVTHTSEKAEAIVSDMETNINEILDKIGDDQPEKTVYFEIAEAPNIVSFGSDTYLNEIIEMLGAKNIFADQQSWVSVSEESVLQENPDIIFTNISYIEDPVAEIMNRNGWDALDAVKNQQVFFIDNNASSLPNENVVIAIDQMAKALYPDIFE